MNFLESQQINSQYAMSYGKKMQKRIGISYQLKPLFSIAVKCIF